VAGNLTFDPKLKPNDVNFREPKTMKGISDAINMYAKDTSTNMLYMSILFDQSNLTVFAPVLDDNERFWRDNYQKECEHDIAILKSKFDTAQHQTVTCLFLQQIMQQTKSYSTSSHLLLQNFNINKFIFILF
jgi:hypothetical protein